MPKSKARRRKGAPRDRSVDWGGGAAPRDRRWNYALLGAALLAAAYGGYAWWDAGRQERAVLAFAAEGEGALAGVETIPSRGGTHLSPGQAYAYPSAFPTSGPHDPTWTPPGLYREPEPPTRLVHALEHGNVVIYYESPGAEAMERLEAWAALYDEQWSGLVVAPIAGLGAGLVLTAWTRRLELERFDPAATAAFIDAYRGRGPEQPVR